MRARELAQFRQMLEAMRNELRQPNRIDSDPAEKGDEADLASADRVREVGIRFRERNRKLLGLIADALERIDDGEYGECEDCGERIPIERLRIRPFATRCVPCQSRRERPGRGEVDAGGLLSEDIDVREFREDRD